MKIKTPYIVLLSMASCLCFGQDKNSSTLDFSGVVYSYTEGTAEKAAKKNKKLLLMEGLAGATVTAYGENDRKYSSTKTNQQGEFQLTLKLGRLYKLELSKRKYIKSTLAIDTREVPPKAGNKVLQFSGAEFMLISSEDSSVGEQVIGTLYYNTHGEYFDFMSETNTGQRGNQLFILSDANNEWDLMRQSVLENKNRPKPQPVPTSERKREEKSGITSLFRLSPSQEIDLMTEQDIYKRQEEIRLARIQLEKDKLKLRRRADSLIIQDRESKIATAELELKNAIKVVEMQKAKIKIQDRLLVLSINSLLVLAVLLSIVFFLYRGKRKMNRVLASKNNNITDSINYAKRIQESILKYENEIQHHFSDSFIYSRPKDIVSGDFFWFSKQNGKYFIAAIDCTGHGVPGAFMSLVGNTLLNEIINQKQIHNPALILEHLHAGVSKMLRQEGDVSSLQDGMDISLCVIDKAHKTIAYSGAINPLYFVQDNFLQVRKADARSIGGITLRAGKNNVQFTNHEIVLKKNTSLYLFTDGYVDQFGGGGNTKFSTTQFRELLMQVQQVGMSEQKERIHQAFEEWKGPNRQIDDVMVVGIRI